MSEEIVEEVDLAAAIAGVVSVEIEHLVEAGGTSTGAILDGPARRVMDVVENTVDTVGHQEIQIHISQAPQAVGEMTSDANHLLLLPLALDRAPYQEHLHADDVLLLSHARQLHVGDVQLQVHHHQIDVEVITVVGEAEVVEDLQTVDLQTVELEEDLTHDPFPDHDLPLARDGDLPSQLVDPRLEGVPAAIQALRQDLSHVQSQDQDQDQKPPVVSREAGRLSEKEAGTHQARTEI
jgi:hypothetical protein